MPAREINKPALIISLAGFIINLIAYYPGFLSSDTIDQYGQSLTGHYSDWHPPVMALVWSLLNKIYQGPQLMLIFQLVMLWAGVYLLLSLLRKARWYVLVTLVALAPFVQNFAALISKDTQMALSWFLVMCILLDAIVKNRKLSGGAIIATVLLILYGCLLRVNALPGAIPLILIWAWCSFRNRTGLVRSGIILVFISAALAGPSLINHCVHAQKTFPENKLFLHDLSGVFVKEGRDVFPSSFYRNPGFDTAYIRQHYHPASFDNLWWNSDGKTFLPDTTGAVTATVRNKWLHTISQYPATYLHNRAEGYIYHLRIKTRDVDYFARFPWIHPNDYGLEYERNFLSRILIQWVELQERLPHMQPYFWLLLNLLLFSFAGRLKGKKTGSIYNALLWSSLLYMLPQFFIFQTDTDFRYYYWNCIACMVAVLLLIGNRYFSHHATSSS